MLKNLPVERDMKALRLFRNMWMQTQRKETTSTAEVSLVYFLSNEQTKDQLDDFRKTVGAVRGCEDISVTVVSNMSAFLPPFAHRLSCLTEIIIPSIP